MALPVVAGHQCLDPSHFDFNVCLQHHTGVLVLVSQQHLLWLEVTLFIVLRTLFGLFDNTTVSYLLVYLPTLSFIPSLPPSLLSKVYTLE